MIRTKTLLFTTIISLLFAYSCAPTGFTKNNHKVLVHESSKMSFPEKVSGFTRTPINVYDESGNKVSVGYNLKTETCHLTVNIYLYPDKGGIEKHFQEVKDSIMQVNQEVKKVYEDTNYFIQEDQVVPGKKVCYRISKNMNGNQTDRMTMAYLYAFGDWIIKYSVSYPSGFESCASLKVVELMQELECPFNET